MVLFHEAVGAKLGLSAADHKALGLITRHGPLTAGELAHRTGLSPGAVTALADRLERGGHARRVPDPGDRRRVLLAAATPPPGVAEIFAELRREMGAVMSRYDAAQIATILDYAAATTEVLRRLTGRLTAADPAGRDPAATGAG
jgi:DNA-binding MarR family transcriptional regulator